MIQESSQNAEPKKDQEVFFGRKKVSHKTKQSLIHDLFSSVAGNYDCMNDLMSMGLHRMWKNEFCLMHNNPEGNILDMAGGTGDIASRLHSLSPDNTKITLCDLNQDMIVQGRRKHYDNNILSISYVNAAAENLPFENNSFDYYSVAFGIRNFANINDSLSEARRVLKPGGRFLCLEFSKPQSLVLSQLYGLYSGLVIPNLGSLFGDRESYQYLVDSIETFYPADIFAALIKDQGFDDVSYRYLSGGIVAIHSAYKK